MFDKHKVFQLNHLNSKKIDDLDPFISFKSKDEIINYIKHITNGKVSHGFQSCHFGQRKLLLSEIMFILYTLPSSLESEGIKRKVVYAGAAPCDHIFFLSELFPDLHFDLFDPAKWNSTFCERFPELNTLKQRNKPLSTYVFNDKIKIHHGYFTDETATYYSELYKDCQVLFISDIRPVDDSSKEDGNYLNWEKVVIENMEEQKRWHTTFHTNSNCSKNNWTLLKFKPTFEIPLQSYLKGDLFFQPYPPLLSAECRLITNSIEETDYNSVELEKLCFYHNTYTRNSNQMVNEFNSFNSFNSLYDTTYEIEICLEYSKQYNAIFKKKYKTIFNMMISISESLGRYGGYNKFLNMYPFQKGYKAPPFIREKWINKIIDLNHSFVKE